MDDNAVAVVISMIVAAVAITVVTFTAVYTHESHIRELRYDKYKIIACLSHGFKPDECRDMVYGRGQ